MKDNIDLKVSTLRDTFLDLESDYIAKLTQMDIINETIDKCRDFSSETLFNAAQKIIDSIEAGQVPYEDLTRAERNLIVLLSAIEDKKKTLVRTLSK